MERGELANQIKREAKGSSKASVSLLRKKKHGKFIS